jgi:NADPH-dependent curcumin reductase CurA
MRAPSVASYSPPFALGSPIGTLGVSRVLRSENPAFAVGDHVYGYHPMSDYNVFPLTHILPSGLKVFDNLGLSSTVWVGAAGMPGQTAKYGLELANPKAGETIFISACSGAVGQVLCQLSKAMGLKVIGSAGSDEKVAFIKELGVDVAFNCMLPPISDERMSDEI